MLSEKPWTITALMRLVLRLVACLCAGLIVACGFRAGAIGKLSWMLGGIMAAGLVFLIAAIVITARPWPATGFVLRAVGLLFCFEAALLFGAWAQKIVGMPQPSIPQMLIGAMSFQGAALVIVWFFVREHGITWRQAFGFSERIGYAIAVAIIAAAVFLPLGWALQQLSIEGLTRLSHTHEKPEEQQAVQVVHMAVTFYSRAILGVITVLLAPVAEELLFRGILYPAIKRAGFQRLALWGSSLLFAAVHLNLAAFLPLLVLAVVLTLLYEHTGNLLAPIVAHALFNGLNFAELLLQDRLTAGS